MAAKHWLIGCGIGCGGLLLAVVLLFVGGAWFVRDTVRGFDAAVDLRETLDERFGDVEAFTPWRDGAVPAERVEVFLAVREATAPARQEVERSFSSLPMSEQEAQDLESKPFFEKMRSVFGIVGAAAGLGGEIGGLFEARNRALLDHGMGMGEYTYIYVVVYYSWLAHSPGDAPENARIRTDTGGVVIRRDDEPGAGLGALGSSRTRTRVLAMLGNQLEALPDDTSDAWRRRLAAEIETLESDRERVPWQDGVPEQIAESLEPFRERLEASYSAVTNPFELLRNKRKGRFSVQAD